MSDSLIAIVGGTGFIGTALAAELVTRGYRCRMLTRRRERAKHLILLPGCDVVETNVHDSAALARGLRDADVVVSMAGILNERHRGDFERVHAELPRHIAQACVTNGVPRLLHVSAIGAAASAPSQYLRTKASGEAAISSAGDEGVAVTCFRPSVVFGPDDDFVNRFANLLALVPVALPLACARARFAPVYVGDVANAIANSVGDKHTYGETYQLCGPEQYTLAEIVRYIARVTGRERAIIGLGNTLSLLQARVMQLLPGQIFTVDNYRSMQVPSVCDSDGLAALGVEAHGMGAVVPEYLGVRSRQAALDRFRAHAARERG